MTRRKRETKPAVKGVQAMFTKGGGHVAGPVDDAVIRASLDNKLYRKKYGRSFWQWGDGHDGLGNGKRQQQRIRGRWKAIHRARREENARLGYVIREIAGEQAIGAAYDAFMREKIEGDEKGLLQICKKMGHSRAYFLDVVRPTSEHPDFTMKFRVKNNDEDLMMFKMLVG